MFLTPKLQDLCLRNVAENITRHGMKVKELQERREISITYEVFKRFCTEDLLKELEMIYVARKVENTTKLFQFLKLLFSEQKSENNKDRTTENCLNLLFNQYTSHLSYSSCEYTGIAEDLLNKVLSLCKNLQVLKLNFCDLGMFPYVSILPFRNSIVEVDLLYSFATNTILSKIVLYCPNIEVFQASGKSITDEFAYGLCRKYFTASRREVQNCSGEVCEVGKKLCYLILPASDISTTGAAHALRHLPSLKVFRRRLYNPIRSNGTVCTAVAEVRNRSLKMVQPPVVFNLTTVDFPSTVSLNTIQRVLESCPQLKSFCLSVSAQKASFFISHAFESLKEICLDGVGDSGILSPEFKKFLIARGSQLETICITNHGLRESLSLTHISDILDLCRNLKTLYLTDLSVSCDHSANYILEAENRPNNLEKLCLSDVHLSGGQVFRFFGNLLSMSLKLRYLSISCRHVIKKCLIPAMNRNGFLRLEWVRLKLVNLRNISLKRLIHKKSNLRKIVLLECDNAVPFAKIHSEAAAKCNFLLHIDVVIRDKVASWPSCLCLFDE